MTKKFYYVIHSRGVDTVAVWTLFGATFNVGELTLAAHAAEVNSFNGRVLELVQAEDALGMARSNRDETAATLRTVCSRALQLISGSLPQGHALNKEVAKVYGIRGASLEAMNRRCLDLVGVWEQANVFRAAQSPAQPPITVDATVVSGFQSSLGNFALQITQVSTKRGHLSEKMTNLRNAATRVDQNNKRWYRAWQGQFAKGTAAREALNLIDTGPKQSKPGQGVFLEAQALAELVLKLSFDGARATSFTLLHKGPASPAFSVLADGLTLKSFEHATGEAGEHQYKLIPHNSAGDGPESVVLTVQVAQQAVA